ATGEVHQHAVALLRGALHRLVGDALATHALEHGVDVFLGDLEHRALDLERLDRLDLDVGHHLDDRGELQVLARVDLDGLHPRAAGRAQLLLGDHVAVGLADQLRDGVAMHLGAELLADDGDGHLALAEAADVRGAREVTQAALHFAGNARVGHLNLDTPLEALGGLDGELHGLPDRSDGLVIGGWCERRDSNSHGLPRWNLNPVRLPVPPLSPRSGRWWAV